MGQNKDSLISERKKEGKKKKEKISDLKAVKAVVHHF